MFYLSLIVIRFLLQSSCSTACYMSCLCSGRFTYLDIEISQHLAMIDCTMNL